jgi:hypothetical protein
VAEQLKALMRQAHVDDPNYPLIPLSKKARKANAED